MSIYFFQFLVLSLVLQLSSGFSIQGDSAERRLLKDIENLSEEAAHMARRDLSQTSVPDYQRLRVHKSGKLFMVEDTPDPAFLNSIPKGNTRVAAAASAAGAKIAPTGLFL